MSIRTGMFNPEEGTTEGRVTLSGLGSYLKRTDPAFSPAEYGHSGLRGMVKNQ